jgi:alkanesulfonate monooxygenase SsuD/methylene tetrahydromethanopterin reductase-like flavin-dependent oxidoreductase (luciferase family)
MTSHIGLANGVVPIDRVPASEFGDRVDRAGLLGERYGERYIAGIGSGRMDRPLAAMEQAIARIRSDTGAPVVIGALRSRMRHLAAEHANGVLLNWLTPEKAAERKSEMAGIRQESGTTGEFSCAAFVRVAIGDGAIARLREEAEKYESFPSYRKHFDEMGVSAFDTAVAASSVEDAAASLQPFLKSLDHAVLRCVVAEEVEEQYRQLVDVARLAVDTAMKSESQST